MLRFGHDKLQHCIGETNSAKLWMSNTTECFDLGTTRGTLLGRGEGLFRVGGGTFPLGKPILQSSGGGHNPTWTCTRVPATRGRVYKGSARIHSGRIHHAGRGLQTVFRLKQGRRQPIPNSPGDPARDEHVVGALLLDQGSIFERPHFLHHPNPRVPDPRVQGRPTGTDRNRECVCQNPRRPQTSNQTFSLDDKSRER